MDEAVQWSGRPAQGDAREDLSSKLIDGPAVVRSAGEMALLLLSASPGQARRFALDSHERACERADVGVVAFWHETLAWLAGRESGAVR